MEEKIKISIITPTFNRANIIKRAINSVLNQNDSFWEYIIVDDCSEDDTAKVINEIKDNRIKYLQLDQNLGNAGARNAGIKIASGKFIAFLDSDDEMEVNALKSFRNTLKVNPDLQYAFGGFKVLNERNGAIKFHKWIPKPEVSFLEELHIGTGCGLFIKKTCFETVGYFDENLRVAVDTDWLIRLDKKYKYTLINDYIVTVHSHEGERVRGDKSELLKAYNVIYGKNQKVIDSKSTLRKRFYYKIQWLNYHQDNIKKGNSFFIRLVKNCDYLKKSIFSFLIFNIFPNKLAKNIHFKISNRVSGGNKI